MSSLYCFRHGQAGLRDNYDALSETGWRQARLLGEHLAAQQMTFRAFFSGGLQRQQETACAIRTAYAGAGIYLPEPVISDHWREFDLTAVYQGIAPQLAADDPLFGHEYEKQEREAVDTQSGVHRRWTPSDISVVRAWVDGRYQYDGESWAGFTERVRAGFAAIAAFGPGENVAVSTSATPIAVWLGIALHLESRYIMRAAGALYNASISSFRMHEGEAHLFTFNSVPHLADPSLRTFR